MQRLKIVTVVGTRPEIIRLSRVLKRLDNSEAIEHVLVHTGQNYDYELNKIFFEDLELRSPDIFLNAAGANALQTIGLILQKIDEALESIKPDAFLVLGDTNSCLAAIAAKKRKIPVFHMEAGNRCFDQRVPEEINRKIVDHIADINLTYSDISRSYLLNEGLPPDRVIKTGSPMFEVLEFYRRKIMASCVVSELGIEKERYFLVSVHREENVDYEENFLSLMDTLEALCEKFKFPVIVSTHPRTQKIIDKHGIRPNSLIRFLKPFSFTDYNALQISAFLVLSDSGTISEESSILDFRALNIRNAHERPEASEEMGVMMTGLKKERILQAIETVKSQVPGKRSFRLVSDYSMPNVAEKIERIIISHVDYVNRNVWRKYL